LRTPGSVAADTIGHVRARSPQTPVEVPDEED